MSRFGVRDVEHVVGFDPRDAEIVRLRAEAERLTAERLTAFLRCPEAPSRSRESTTWRGSRAAQRCSFGCADWRRHCTRPAVYETTTLRACEEHRQQFDTIGGPDTIKRGWRRIDGGAVAIVLVVLAFMLCPGCSTAAAQVSPRSDTRDIVEIVCATVIGLSVLALIGWSRGWLRSDARARDCECPHDYTCRRCDRWWTYWCSGCGEPTCDVHACGCEDDEDGAK